MHRVPGLGVLEACFILLPLAVHGAMGVWLVATQRPLATPRPYSPNMRVAMRIAGIGVLAFLAMHLPEDFAGETRANDFGGSATADLLAADLSWTWQGLPWRALAYLVGAGCAAFHFGVGFWGLFAGSSQGQSSSRARVTAAWGLGAASFAIWLGFANVWSCMPRARRCLAWRRRRPIPRALARARRLISLTDPPHDPRDAFREVDLLASASSQRRRPPPRSRKKNAGMHVDADLLHESHGPRLNRFRAR